MIAGVATLMWLLVLLLSLRSRKRPNNIILWCAVLIAIAMTTNVTPVYELLDTSLFFPNTVDLIANLALIFGVHLLAITIINGASIASSGVPKGLKSKLPAVIVVMVVMVLTFFLIDAPHSSTTFMLDYGDQVAAAAYSGVQYLYYSAIFLEALLICVKAIPKMTIPRFRIGFTIIAIGCILSVLLGLSVVAMDLLHLTDRVETMKTVGSAYELLRLSTVFFLCLGLSIPTLGKMLTASRSNRRASTLEPQLEHLWSETVGTHAHLSLSGVPNIKGSAPMENIHRMIVEIRDWELSGDGRSLSSSEALLLEMAESLCLQENTGRSDK